MINEYPKALKQDGKYVLPWKTAEKPPDSKANFKYMFTPDQTHVPDEKTLNEEPSMQLTPADPTQMYDTPESGIRTTWLGHASVLFQLDTVNILVNPNFNNMKSYSPGRDKQRYRASVYSVDDLPRIDCVFITNTHYDYLDLSSVSLLSEKYSDTLWYVPMGAARWMRNAGCQTVIEMEWWSVDAVDFIDDHLDFKRTEFKVYCTPSQSYHDRNTDDGNAMLWCSWVVMSPRYRLFISGGTGYNDVIFKSIGKRYGPIHIAAIPIGGYEPSWKFGFANVTPEQAVQIHEDVSATRSVGVSWGTFTVSNEHYLEPPKRLSKELEKRGLSDSQFFVMKHGESRVVEINFDHTFPEE